MNLVKTTVRWSIRKLELKPCCCIDYKKRPFPVRKNLLIFTCFFSYLENEGANQSLMPLEGSKLTYIVYIKMTPPAPSLSVIDASPCIRREERLVCCSGWRTPPRCPPAA